jgi:putative ABC transport system permease protein
MRNLLRKPASTAAIMLGMAAVSGSLFALSIIYSSGTESILRGISRLGADAMVVPAGVMEGAWGVKGAPALISGGPAAVYMDAAVAEGLRDMPAVEAAACQVFIVSARLACCSVSDVALIGFEPERDFTITPWLRENLGRGLLDDEIIVGGDILSEPGGRMRFYGKLFLIAGKLEPTGMGYMDDSVFIPMPGAREMIARSGEEAESPLDIKPDEVSAVMLRLNNSAPHEETAVRIEHMFPGHGVVLAGEVVRNARRNIALPLKAALAAGVLQWAASLVMVGVLYGLSLSGRRKELGILRAVGARRGQLMRLFALEAVLLSGGGGILGIACGWTFTRGFRGMFEAFLGFSFSPPSTLRLSLLVLMTLLFSIASGCVATLYPILKEAGKAPFEAISDS